MLNQNPRHADFVLGSCPHCDKVVRIPVTAVTSQSSSQVRCPICDLSFEIGDVLEDTIPSVEIVEDSQPVPKSELETQPAPDQKNPERINAIDTPDLFHISKDDYEPITEKKNGRFVVPELLSKGIKKKRKRTRRRRSRSSDDPQVAQRLEKLKNNSSAKSFSGAESDTSTESPESGASRHRSSRKSNSSESSRSRRSRNSKPKAKFRLSSLFNFEKPSSRAEFIMIGLGVMMAIPVLHLVMWWFVGIDPLGLAKPTAYVAPVIVPNELKATEVEEEGNLSADSKP